MNPVFKASGLEEAPPHTDPYIRGKWYFWTETWADSYGPYDTEEEANAACDRYAEQL